MSTKTTPMVLNDIYPGGAMLQQKFGKTNRLYLWHFAYRNGKQIELVRVDSPKALEMANEYWGRKLLADDMPRVLVDADDKAYERRWFTIHFGNLHDEDEEIQD